MRGNTVIVILKNVPDLPPAPFSSISHFSFTLETEKLCFKLHNTVCGWLYNITEHSKLSHGSVYIFHLTIFVLPKKLTGPRMEKHIFQHTIYIQKKITLSHLQMMFYLGPGEGLPEC